MCAVAEAIRGSVMRLISCLFAATLMQNSALADSYDCKSVDRLATTYVPNGVAVAVTSKDKECTFSVNGASSSNQSNQSREDVKRSLNLFKLDSGGAPSARDILIIFSAAGGSLPDRQMRAIIDVIGQNNREIENCVRDFKASPTSSSDGDFGRGGLSCRKFSRAENVSFGPLVYTVETPHLRIAVQEGRDAAVIIVPVQFVAAPQLR